MVGLTVVTLVVANNGIQVNGITQPSTEALYDNRWEPSSSIVGSQAVTTWTDFISQASYSASWALHGGSWSWSTPVFHTSSTSSKTGDLYLTYNPAGVHDLVFLDSAGHLVFQSSTDSTGSNWNSPISVYSVADYPSVAVASNGTIAVGLNTTDGTSIYGYQSMVSTNGGQNWTGPYAVTSSQYQAFGRIVWSPQSNAFHVLFVDSTNWQTGTFNLERAQSSDGVNWSIAAPIDTYTAPAKQSPGPVVNNTYIYYSTNIDASAASGLGWVVVYPAARSDDPTINNVKYCAETLGCTTISYSNDLFLQGITTSASSDLWMNLFTYSDPSSRVVPLKQIAIYRTPGGSSVSAFVDPPGGIDPTSWIQLGSGPHCNILGTCYAMGDYARPAMNTVTGAMLPFVNPSSYMSALFQTFVQDPPAGLPQVPGLSIGPALPFGRNSTFKGVLPAGFATQRRPITVPSFLVYTQRR